MEESSSLFRPETAREVQMRNHELLEIHEQMQGYSEKAPGV